MKKFTFLLIFMLFFCINANAEEIIRGSDYQVNPVYEYLNIEYAKLYESEPESVTYTECTDYEGAFEYLKEQAKNRNPKIYISYTSDINGSLPVETIEELVLQEAVDLFSSLGDYSEFDKNGDSSDYIYYQWYSRDIDCSFSTYSYGRPVDVFLAITVNWFTTPEQISEENVKVKEILDELNVYDEDEYTQVKAVYDYVLDNVEYVDTSKYDPEIEEKPLYHSSYSALIMGETVCQGYATAIYRLLRELGISCRVVSGSAGGDHAWNMVRIGSYYYLVDATWDDQPYDRTKYFLKAKYSDHTAEAEFLSTDFKRFFPMAAEDYTETLYYIPNAPQNVSIVENDENITIKFDLDYTAQYAAICVGDEFLYVNVNSVVNDTTTHTVTHTPQNGTTAYEITALRMEYNSRTGTETSHYNTTEEIYLSFEGTNAHLTQNIDFEKIPADITTVTGVSNTVTVTLPEELSLTDDLTFDNLILSGACTIYANGHKLTITDTVTSDARLTVYGGGKKSDVNGDTYLNLNGGLYKNVYGGGYNGKVTGNTTVIFGGNANKGDVFTSSPCKVFGGGNNGAVEGTTSVTLKDNAVALYLVGSGVNTGGTCNGTHIQIQGGSVMNVYAGSTNVALHEGIQTKITMTGGKAEALFGGCEAVAMTGHTRIYLLGGYITRRVYTGCYNGTDDAGNCLSDRYVKGTTALYIGPSATINTSTGLLDKETVNTGVFIGSRTTSSHSDEINTVVYLDNCFDTHNQYIGEKHWLFKSKFKSFENYIIKEGLNGTVEFTTDGKLKLIPDKKYYSLFNGAKAEETVSLTEETNTVTFDKLKIFFELVEEKDNKVKLDIIAEEPAYLFTGTFKKGVLKTHTFKQATTEEAEVILDTDSTNKIFFWTNGLKPLAEPIVR